jgi:hypothetical protein
MLVTFNLIYHSLFPGLMHFPPLYAGVPVLYPGVAFTISLLHSIAFSENHATAK